MDQFPPPPTGGSPKTSSKFWPTIIGSVLISGLAWTGIWWWYRENIAPLELSPTPTVSQDETSNWKTYRNEKYGFEVKYPPAWNIYEDERIEPIINIYKTGTPPHSHFSNETHVSVFPFGLATEGAGGDSKEIDMDLIIDVKERVTAKFLSNNNQIRAYFITFVDQPENWGEYGFLWAGVQVKNQSVDAIDNPDGYPTLKYNGEVSSSDLKTIERILSTFKFTK